MKIIPNCISFSRIIFSLLLLFVKPLSSSFYAIYIISGISDMLDGYIARRMGTTSRLGEKLDSIGDIIMVGVLLLVLFPILSPGVEIIIWIILISGLRVASILVAFKKYRTFAALHTYGNKITGIMLFIFPLFFPIIHEVVLIYAICTVASLSALEELIIQLTSKELEVNRKSVFVK